MKRTLSRSRSTLDARESQMKNNVNTYQIGGGPIKLFFCRRDLTEPGCALDRTDR